MRAPNWLISLASAVVERAGTSLTPPWYWPGGSGGDRGPPGSWQMGTNPLFGQPEQMLAFSAVYACVKIISEDIAKLPAQVFKIEDDARILQPVDRYAQLLAQPNDYQTGTDFMQLLVTSALYRGNGFVFTPRNNRGEIAEMHVLDPRQVQPVIEPETGEVFYRCGYNRLAGITSGLIVPSRFMINHRLSMLAHYPLYGLTPIMASAAAAQVGLDILGNSQKLFSNQSRPGGVLQAPGKISKETATRLKEEWDNNFSNERYGKTAVLPEGLTWSTMTMTAQDAELIAQLRYSVEDVARAFRVPPFMLGDTTKTTYRNSEQLARFYLTGCLGYHLRAIEQRFEQAFEFGPLDELRFDLSGLLRAEIDVRFTAYMNALNAGWMAPNEVRAVEGLPPVEGGDEPHLQQQYIPLSQSGKIAPTAPAPVADPTAPGVNENIDAERVRLLLGQRRRLSRRAA